jgi:ABC-2 type transport system permease protein
MESKAIYTIWLREMKKYMRSKPRIIGSLMMPFMFLAILGVGLSSSFGAMGAGGANYLQFLSPGIIGMSILFTSVFAGISVIFDRQFGFMKEMLVAPVSRTSIAIGKILGSATISMITALMIFVIATLLGGINLATLTIGSFLGMLGFMALAAVSFVSIGLIIAAKLNDTEGFQLIVNVFVMPLFFLSGAFFPVTSAPTWMQGLSYIDPLFYAVDGMRGLLINTSTFSTVMDFGILSAMAIALVIISGYFFGKMPSK